MLVRWEIIVEIKTGTTQGDMFRKHKRENGHTGTIQRSRKNKQEKRTVTRWGNRRWENNRYQV